MAIKEQSQALLARRTPPRAKREAMAGATRSAPRLLTRAYRSVLMTSIVTVAALIAGSGGSTSPPHTSIAQAVGATPPAEQIVPVAKFDATGLLPTDPSVGMARRVSFPAGYDLKHYHSAPRFVYVLSGTVQLTDDSGTSIVHAGDFFHEPALHVHTFHAITDVQTIGLTFLRPGVQETIPLGPATGHSTMVMLASFDPTPLLPTGPATGIATMITTPRGFFVKRFQASFRFVYVLSGTIDVADAQGLKT